MDRHAGHGIRPGLERITAVVENLGNPYRSYPVIHVAGTNGKTSTSRIIGSLAAAHGLTAGTFTSPHLERVEERLAVAAQPATQEGFAAAIADVAPFVDIFEERSGDSVTYFELLTAAAFAYFADNSVDLAVVEVGLGGRLDATNVVDAAVSVLTGVTLEHTEYLGDTLAEIAAEKAAILAPGGTLVTGRLDPEAAAAVAARVAETGARWRRYGPDFHIDDMTLAVGGWQADLEGVYERYPDVYLPLHGRHQVENLMVAVAALEELFGRALSPEAVVEGAAAAASPGRLEVVGRDPLVILDGAHTPEAMERVVAALDEEFLPTRWVVVVGVMGDKDVAAMLSHLEGRVEAVVAVAAESERALAPAAVAAAAGAVLPGAEVVEAASVADGVATAIARAGTAGAVAVVGSLYVVGEARPAVRAAESAH